MASRTWRTDLADHPELANLHGATGIVFKAYAPGYFSDFHTAPRRQYVINVAGEKRSSLAMARSSASGQAT